MTYMAAPWAGTKELIVPVVVLVCAHRSRSVKLAPDSPRAPALVLMVAWEERVAHPGVAGDAGQALRVAAVVVLQVVDAPGCPGISIALLVVEAGRVTRARG
jgi:hypothetical protein